MAEKVKVSEAVFCAIQDLKNSGRTRMNDVPNAVRHLEEMGAYAASDWVQDHLDLYVKGLMEGFEVR